MQEEIHEITADKCIEDNVTQCHITAENNSSLQIPLDNKSQDNLDHSVNKENYSLTDHTKPNNAIVNNSLSENERIHLINDLHDDNIESSSSTHCQ